MSVSAQCSICQSVTPFCLWCRKSQQVACFHSDKHWLQLSLWFQSLVTTLYNCSYYFWFNHRIAEALYLLSLADKARAKEIWRLNLQPCQFGSNISIVSQQPFSFCHSCLLLPFDLLWIFSVLFRALFVWLRDYCLKNPRNDINAWILKTSKGEIETQLGLHAGYWKCGKLFLNDSNICNILIDSSQTTNRKIYLAPPPPPRRLLLSLQ